MDKLQEWYGKTGYRVFPLNQLDKTPATANGFKNATDFSMGMLPDGQGKNIGIATGEVSGVWVLDIDLYKDASLLDKLKKHGELPSTFTVKTRAGGRHYYFTYNNQVAHLTIGQSIQYTGIDYRCNGGYVVGPGSYVRTVDKHTETVTEGIYSIENDVPVVAAPEWLISFLTQAKQTRPEDYRGSNGSVIEGGRNAFLTSWAGRYINQGRTTADELKALLVVRNNSDCTPPLSYLEVVSIAESAVRNFQKSLNLSSDMSFVDSLSEQLSKEFKFCPYEKMWYYLSDNGWKKDMGNGNIFNGVKQFIQCHINMLPNDMMQEQTRKLLNKYLSVSKMSAVISALSQHNTMLSDNLSDPVDTIVCPKGIIVLEDGVVASMDNKLHKLSTTVSPKVMPTPKWDAFLTSTFCGNQDLIHYLQKVIGYSASGRCCEHSVFFLVGSGSNGKSTFIETIQSVLGGYAEVLQPEVIMESRFGNGGSMDSLAVLTGKRLVSASEVPDGLLAEERIKRLSGGDSISAQHKFGRSFSYTPEFTLFYSSNHRPTISRGGNGIWRRIKEIPFNAIFDETNTISGFKQILLKEEAEGILQWILDGFKMYLKEGLNDIPQVVKDAIAQYKEDEDIIAQFIQDECVIGEGIEYSSAILYNTYVKWARENGYGQGSNKTFKKRIEEKGYKYDKSKDRCARIVKGLMPKHPIFDMGGK